MATENSPTYAPDFLKLLSNDIRWQILKALIQSDRKVHELVALTGEAQNTVSYHLQLLREQELVKEHRSLADGREIYYSIDLERIRQLYFASGEELHSTLGNPNEVSQEELRLIKRPRVLFLCTHNSARSQMAEGILRYLSKGDVEVYSAGSEPLTVHPLAIRALEEMNIDINEHQAKHQDQFIGQDFDYIITVCDRAREICPIFPSDPIQIHWSIPDPSAVEGLEKARYQAFREVAVQFTTRISFLLTMINRRLYTTYRYPSKVQE